MGLNHLLYRQQLSLMRAQTASSPFANQLFRRSAGEYQERVCELQRELGVIEPMFRRSSGLITVDLA